jgi:predicted RNA-binding Zn ribbon-like protein
MGDEQLAAPGDLEQVRQFVNTRDLELGTDTLETWFGPADLDRAVALREAFRALLLSNATGGDPPLEAVETIERIGRRATLRVDGDLQLVPTADAELARLLAIAVVAQADGSWLRLKACPGDGCQWALYDRTRSRTRTWCAAAKCGARTRSREYRRRRRTSALQEPHREIRDHEDGDQGPDADAGPERDRAEPRAQALERRRAAVEPRRVEIGAAERAAGGQGHDPLATLRAAGAVTGPDRHSTSRSADLRRA